MLKLLGSVIIIASCGMAGLLKARIYTRRPNELRCLQSALQILETEIAYAASPLAKAFHSVAVCCEKKVAVLFRSASQELLSMSGQTAGEAWDKALAVFYPQTALSQSDLSILRNFGSTLGISDREDQIKHLRLTQEQLKAETDKAEEEAGRNAKIWNYFGFFGGIVAVLILV